VFFKKFNGNIYDVDLSKAEQRALDRELSRQMAAYDEKHSREIDAIVLWSAHNSLNLGPKKLKQFYFDFAKEFQALLDRYEFDISDGAWKCTEELKRYGIDLEEWEKELEGKS
jgi:hypothetical protein